MSEWTDLDPTLITSEVCMRCGGCCKYTHSVPVHTEAFAEYIEAIYEKNDMITTTRELDKMHLTSRCSNLIQDKDAEGDLYMCQVYQDRPEVCSRFNCFEDANKHHRLPQFYTRIMRILDDKYDDTNQVSSDGHD